MLIAIPLATSDVLNVDVPRFGICSINVINYLYRIILLGRSNFLAYLFSLCILLHHFYACFLSCQDKVFDPDGGWTFFLKGTTFQFDYRPFYKIGDIGIRIGDAENLGLVMCYPLAEIANFTWVPGMMPRYQR